ncbi:unnamed protein product, partial [Iphiclides podalirius]
MFKLINRHARRSGVIYLRNEKIEVPAIRDYFKIPKLIKHTPENLPIKKKGFVEGAKDSWTNMKLSRDLADRQRIDEMIFTKAGKGAIQKTYKFDPTKLSNVQAKSKL